MATTTATLINGSARYEDVSLVGLSVASARSLYKSAFHIAATARATVNGREAAGETILAAGDILNFDEATGQKG